MTGTNHVEDGDRPWIEQLAILIGGRLLNHHGVTVTTTPVITPSGPEITISAMLPSEFHWTVRIPNPPVDFESAVRGIAAAFIVAQRNRI
jgi:hypothetical protein